MTSEGGNHTAWGTPKAAGLWSPVGGHQPSTGAQEPGKQQPPLGEHKATLQGPSTGGTSLTSPPCSRRKVRGPANLLLPTHNISKPLETPDQSGQPLGKGKSLESSLRQK